jgi:hypothetical protein
VADGEDQGHEEGTLVQPRNPKVALLLALLVFLLAHLRHLSSVEPTGLRERWHTEVVKINEDDCINLFWLLRSPLSPMAFVSAMNQQMTVYRYVPRRIHELKRRLCEGRGDHSG